jgi:uncharacterized protein YukE
MTAMIKADLPQLDTLSRRLGSCSNDVGDLKANMTSLLSGTDWTGGAAQRVRDAWDTQFRPALDEMAAALTDMSGEVAKRRAALNAAGN